MGPGYFQWSPVTGQGTVGRNWKFHLSMRKKMFTLRLTEHLNRLPIEVMESSSVEILKTYLCNLL